MSIIEEAREKINRIDKEMACLFEERMKAVSEISEYKKENNLPVFDAKREDAVIEKNQSLVKEEFREYYIKFLKNVMNVSKDFQNALSGNIVIKTEGLDEIEKYFDLSRKVLIVTDSNIPEKYIKKITVKCKKSFVKTVKPGEESKSLEAFGEILSFMLENGFERSDAVVACGGGVAGDLAGFCASCYMRGIDFYNVPTSLLSQVDSSVGGKTAVNLKNIKNVVGTFYQPKMVVIDPKTLESLPKREFSSGMAEVIKTAACLDGELFEFLENNDFGKNIEEIIKRTVNNKIRIVNRDEKENGLRRVLNFGHTIGHGIEVSTSLNHGESVGMGMLPMCSKDVGERIEKLLKKADLPVKVNVDASKVVSAVRHDKKSANGKIDVVKVKEIGSFYFEETDIEELEKIIREVLL